ncbi:MAG: peptide chain release factor 2 [Anaerolineae bacterium]|nr:peptide chain release factor 2 [Anaerolineae bacterium]
MSKETKLKKLQKETEAPDFWNDSNHARRVMKTVTRLQEETESWNGFWKRLQDLIELAEMGDESILGELEAETDALEKDLDKRAFRAMLSGKYDSEDALLAIHAGAGGTDSQDWAAMLQRMYLRWAERRGYQVDVLDLTVGEEAGIKSTTLSISGNYVFGYLRSEKGTHRLVRISPFDSAHRRHTSFALVEVLPQIGDENMDVEINARDLRVDVYKSSGAGGQSVQKNSTAVRLTHLPTGIVVTCQNERSQLQNRENALRVLRARLLELKEAEQKEELDGLRGEYTKAEWGSQIRSYVLHPYQLVKDHRSDFEMGNTQAVLDGDLDSFMEAYLQQASS